MKTIIAYKENDGVSFVAAGNSYYAEIRLDTDVKGIYRLSNGLVIATPVMSNEVFMLDVLNDALGEDDVELNEDYLKDTFIPTLYDVYDEFNMIEMDQDTGAASLAHKMIVAKGSTMYLINYDLDFWYVPEIITLGSGESNINLMLSTNIYKNLEPRERMKKIIQNHYKYQKHTVEKFIYMNTLSDKEEII